MKAALLLLLSLGTALAHAAPPSCLAKASDPESFDECAQQEILPLETRRVHALSALRTKYRGEADLLRQLESSEDSWNAYRNAYCGAEAAVKGRGSDVERKRAYSACAKRTLEQHVRELESL